MSAAKSKRWACQFCGLGAEQDEKPVLGACSEREGAAHSWMNATILESDPDVLAELQAKVEARGELVSAAAREAFGEKVRETDVDDARRHVRLLQVEGDGLQTALLEVQKHGAEEAGKRSVRDRMCFRCGWPQPISGSTCLAGVGHHAPGDARDWWTPEEHAAKKDDLQRHRDILAHQIGEANLEAGLAMFIAGESWDAVRGALPKPAPVVEEPAAVELAPAVSPEDLAAVGSSPTPMDPAEISAEASPVVSSEEPAPPAKRGRGRPRKDGGAPAAAKPLAPGHCSPEELGIVTGRKPWPEAGSPHAKDLERRGFCSEFEDVEPEVVGAMRPTMDPELAERVRETEGARASGAVHTISSALGLIGAIDEALTRIEHVQRVMAGERNGHVFAEVYDELHRRRGVLGRVLDRLDAADRMGKAAAE